MSSSTVNKMRSHQTLRNINHFIGWHNLFQTKRTYLLNKGEKTPFRKIVILAKLLLCETSSSTVNKMRGDQALGNIDHFIGGHILFRTKRAYLLNKGEKTPFRKIVIVAKLLLLLLPNTLSYCCLKLCLGRLDFHRLPGPVFDRRMSVGSFSRTAAGNRAYV